VRDAALLLQTTAGFDPRDPLAVVEPAPDFVAACDLLVRHIRIARSPPLRYAKPDPEVVALCESAARAFEDFGCTVELVETVMEEDPEDIWMAAFYTGAGARQKQVLDTRPELLDPAIRQAFERALDRPLAEYLDKGFARDAFREKMRAFFESYDLLLSPALPVPAFDVGLNAPPQDPQADIVGWVRYTYPFNLTGTPAASVPAGFTEDGLPVGLQIAAGALREADIFAAAAALEEARPWADRRPDI
jgi:aspartyl-tRNA(Asn)/glutamyl-tRNA(Gln) amidotransferase subunit A